LPHRRLLRRFDSATPSNYLSIVLNGYGPGFGWLCIAAYHCDPFDLRTLPLIFSHCSVLIRLPHLQLHAPAFDAAGFCAFSFDPPSLCFRMVAFGFPFDIFSWVHSCSMPLASALSVSILLACRPSFRHVHLRFVFSALRLPWFSSANNAAACALVSPSISSAACTRLRCSWCCFASLHQAYFKIPLRTRFLPHRFVALLSGLPWLQFPLLPSTSSAACTHLRCLWHCFATYLPPGF
jgi:hypothetical protein